MHIVFMYLNPSEFLGVLTQACIELTSFSIFQEVGNND